MLSQSPNIVWQQMIIKFNTTTNTGTQYPHLYHVYRSV